VTEDTKLGVGDEVQVKWNGDWIDGTIVEIDATFDDIRVQFIEPTPPGVRRRRPHSMDWSFKRHLIRIAAKGAHSIRGNPSESGKELRTWEDDTGKFRIQAELVEVKGDSVVLKRRDGETMTVPTDRLSKKDREFIARTQVKGDDGEASDGEVQFIDELPTKHAEASSAKVVDVAKEVDSSGLEPDSGARGEELTQSPATLPGREDALDIMCAMFVAAETPERILIPFTNTHEHDKPTRFVLCNLARGATEIQTISFPVSSVAIDLGPSGKQVLSHPNGSGPGGRRRVDIWTIKEGRLRPEVGWEPYAEEGAATPRDVVWGAFIDQNHVGALNESGELIVWSVPDVKAVYRLKLLPKSRPALSSGRKYLAALTNSGLVVVDAKTGDSKGVYRGAGKEGAIAFRPDGKRIALASRKRVQIWEFAGGKLYRDIGVEFPEPPGGYIVVATQDQVEAAGGLDQLMRSGRLWEAQSQFLGLGAVPIAWPAPGYLLIDSRYLIDVEKYTVLWDYLGVQLAGSLGQRFLCLARQDGMDTLVPQTLPHREAMEAASGLSEEQYRGIQPGETVSVEMRVSASSQKQKEIETLLRRQLEDHGIKVAPNQRLKLVVSTELGETEKIVCQKLRGLIPTPQFSKLEGAPETIGFRQQISKVVFLIDGKLAWESSHTVGAPSHIPLKEGESVEQAVRKYEKPDLEFFSRVQLPAHVARPRRMRSFGASVLTPEGVRPGKVRPRERKSDRSLKPPGESPV
jgi:hypothetical protein